jgi:hypothetical protein
MNTPGNSDEEFWSKNEELSRQHDAERRRIWWSEFRIIGGFLLVVAIYGLFFSSCGNEPEFYSGYWPCNVVRLTDDKGFHAVAEVRAYPQYREFDVPTRFGEEVDFELTGYTYDVVSIVLRNGDRHTLREPLFGINLEEVNEVITEDHVWDLMLVPSTKETQRSHKVVRGNFPILQL